MLSLKKSLLLFLLAFISISLFAQSTVSFTIYDSITHRTLGGVSIVKKGTQKGAVTSLDGKASLMLDANSSTVFDISYINYESRTLIINATTDTAVEVLLAQAEHQMEEVIVSSTRTNSRLEDLPTRVEVLGSEEVAEENGIKPGNIASLLGDIAGIQIQQTSAATGNADMRIQGVPGKYTQLLRDGMPLYGGYGGSFSILQIPPLDLQQIELIKGASSTLYGNGAIAGMVNLISKKPVKGSVVKAFTLNRSTLKENNLNAFFSGRNEKSGYTFFTGGTLQNAVDVNKDGYSDVPDVKSIFVHPRLFLYTSPSSTVIFGYTMNYEDRKGGDMLALTTQKNTAHPFFIQNKSLRNTADVNWDKKINENSFFNIKGSTSFFNRDIATNVFGMKANQTSWYSEAAYTTKAELVTFVGGVNWNGEDFKKKQPDSSQLTNYKNFTLGAFAQADWRLTRKLTAQTGLRADDVYYQAAQKLLLLPRLSLMYKFDPKWTARVGGGLGYKLPTPFSVEVDERDYHYLSAISAITSLERSSGANADVNFKTKAGGWSITINQGFFLTHIKNPMLINYTSPTLITYTSASRPLVSSGTESYVQLQHDELELYFGYTYTNALRQYNSINEHLPLTAKHKMASVLAYEFSEKFRAGIEASYTGTQYLDNGATTNPYLFMAAMVRYNLGKVAFVLNGENLFDYRLSKKQAVVFAPYSNPSFPEIWAPLEGRVINLSMMIKW